MFEGRETLEKWIARVHSIRRSGTRANGKCGLHAGMDDSVSGVADAPPPHKTAPQDMYIAVLYSLRTGTILNNNLTVVQRKSSALVQFFFEDIRFEWPSSNWFGRLDTLFYAQPYVRQRPQRQPEDVICKIQDKRTIWNAQSGSLVRLLKGVLRNCHGLSPTNPQAPSVG